MAKKEKILDRETELNKLKWKKMTFREKAENFFYIYKGQIIAGTVLAASVIVGLILIFTPVKYDFGLYAVMSGEIDSETITDTIYGLQAYAADKDSNAEINLHAGSIRVFRRQDTVEPKEEKKILKEIGSGEYGFYAADDTTFDYMSSLLEFADLEELFPDCPYIRGDRLYLNGSPLQKQHDPDEVLPKDISISFVKSGDEETDAYYINVLTRLIEERPYTLDELIEAGGYIGEEE